MAQLLLFMTPADEREYSAQLRTRFPQLAFIDGALWQALPPPVTHDIADGSSMIVLLLNQAIVSFEEYTGRFTKPHPSGSGYMGGQVGPGLVQFWKSTNPKAAPTHLQNGRVAASYDSSESETDAFVKAVWSITRKGARQVFAIDRATGAISDRPDPKFLAWPDAAERYNGEGERYLAHTVAHFFVARP